MAATAYLPVVAPDNEKCTVQSAPARLPRRKPNAESLLHVVLLPARAIQGAAKILASLARWRSRSGGGLARAIAALAGATSL